MTYEMYHLDCTLRTDRLGRFAGVGVHNVPKALWDTLPGRVKIIPADGKYKELHYKELGKYITFYLGGRDTR